jgi:hypothetical protein
MSKLLFFFVSAAAAHAATVVFTALPVNTRYGTYNGYAAATVDGAPGQMLICDDFAHTTYVPSGPLTYVVSSMAGPDGLHFVRFTENAVERYHQAALLLDGLDHSSAGLLDLTAEYQYALWHLFTPSTPMSVTAETLLAETAVRAAALRPEDMAIYTRLEIYTPSQSFATNQEFLRLAGTPPPFVGLDPPKGGVATPEPGPGPLIAVGVLLMAVGLWRRSPMRSVLAKATRGSSPHVSEP